MAIDWDKGQITTPETPIDWDKGKITKPNKGLVGDVGTALKQGIQQIPGMVTGVADIVPGALNVDRPVSKAADWVGEKTGFQPSKWAKQAEAEYSPETVRQRANVDQVWKDPNTNATDVAGAYLTNPRATAMTAVQSIPSMVTGGVAGRAIGAATGIASAPVRAAIGEGSVMAGQQMSEIDPNVNPQKAALASLAAGVLGGAVGYAGGKIAGKLGVGDVDTMIAGGAQATGKSLPIYKRIPGAMVQEGLLEEAPQSAIETATKNYAEDKPLTEGMARNVVEGAIAGGLMGGVAGVVPQRAQAPVQETGTPSSDVPPVQPPASPVAQQEPASTAVVPEPAAQTPQEPLQSPEAPQAEPQSVTPSKAMGLDPAAGPMSAAATVAVDGGAHQSIKVEQDAVTGMSDEDLRGYLRNAQDPSIRRAVADELQKRKSKENADASNADAAGGMAPGSGGPMGVDAIGGGRPARLLEGSAQRGGDSSPTAPVGAAVQALPAPDAGEPNASLTKPTPTLPPVKAQTAPPSGQQENQNGQGQEEVLNTRAANVAALASKLKGKNAQTKEAVTGQAGQPQSPAAAGVSEWKDRETAPVGSWVKADFKTEAEQPVYRVESLDVDRLYLPELTEDGRLQPEKRKSLAGYTERAKAGEKPPSITVIEMEDGRLRVVDGHRRVMAAKAAGQRNIRALVSPLVDGKAASLESPSNVQNPQAGTSPQAIKAPTQAQEAVGGDGAQPSTGVPVAGGAGEQNKQSAPTSTVTNATTPINDGAQASTPSSKKGKALSVGLTPANAEPVTVQNGTVYIGKNEALNFDTGEPVKVSDGATQAEIRKALSSAGALSRRQKFFGGDTPLQTSRSVVKAPVTTESDSVDAPFAHAGLKISKRNIKSGDSIESRWVVQSPENAERESRGERQIGGDSIVSSREEAIKTAEREAKNHAADKARKAEIDAQEKADRDALEAKKAASRGKSIVERRADAILDKPTTLPPSLALGTGTKREAMQRAVDEGRLIREVMVRDTAAKKRDEDAISRVRASGYILGLSNENIPVVKAGLEAQARLKENKYEKPEYRVYAGQSENDPFREISKTEYDYAQQIKAYKPAESKPDQETAAKVKKEPNPLLEQEASKTSSVATHQDPGEKPEAVTPAVVNDAVKTAAENRDRPIKEVRADAIRLIDEAIAAAPSGAEIDGQIGVNAVRTSGGKKEMPGVRKFPDGKTVVVLAREASANSGRWSVTDESYDGSGTGRKRNTVLGTLEGTPAVAREQLMSLLRRIRPDGTVADPDMVTIRVPGDGVFKVMNTKERLLEFRKQVEKSDGFKDRQPEPKAPEKVNDKLERYGVESGSGGTKAAIENMIDEGDPQAAKDYAEATGVDIREVLKGQPARLAKLADVERSESVLAQNTADSATGSPSEPKKQQAASDAEKPIQQPEVGMVFTHRRVMDADNKPMRYRVTRIAKGVVYYAPLDGGKSEKTGLDEFSRVLGKVERADGKSSVDEFKAALSAGAEALGMTPGALAGSYFKTVRDDIAQGGTRETVSVRFIRDGERFGGQIQISAVKIDQMTGRQVSAAPTDPRSVFGTVDEVLSVVQRAINGVGPWDSATGKQSLQVPGERFAVGKSLNREQRKQVLGTLVDVYKAKDAEREFKGMDSNGNERYGYAHSPDLFEKSDITGSPVRYYVTLPDGRKAHPTELFPDYTQSDIDAEMQRREQEEISRKASDASRLRILQSRIADDLGGANRIFNRQNPGARDYIPATLTDGKQFIRTAPESAERDAELLGGNWRVQVPSTEDSSGVAFSRKNSEPFYSALSKEIDAANINASNVMGWKAALKGLVNKGAVKQDEIEWTGLGDWLDLQAGKVTKQQVQEYLSANGVQVQEVVLGGRFSVWKVYNREGEFQEALESKAEADAMAEKLGGHTVQAEKSRDISGRPSKYSKYTLPGGENYREVLLTLPVKPLTSEKLQKLEREYDALTANYTDADNERMGDLSDAINAEREKLRAADRATWYKSSHWDQANVLAHIRVNDRTDADGKRVMLIEEIQSDFAQDARKKGIAKSYRPEDVRPISAIEAGRMTVADERLFWFFKTPDNVFSIPKSKYADQDAARDYIVREKKINSGGVPAAPYIDSTDKWLALALKRIIKMAVDEGYDRVAFVNGEQSAKRYGLSKQVDRIEVTPRSNADGTPAGKSILIVIANRAGDMRLGVDANGVIDNQRGADAGMVGKPLDDVIGKDLARRVMGMGRGTLDGEGLKIGGEGMKTFYDRIVPNAVNGMLKKMGGGTLEAIGIGDLSQPAFTITPAMREKAAGGMPLFKRQRPTFSRGAQQQATLAVEKVVNGIKANWANAPEIVVAFDLQDPRIPEAVRKEDQKQRSNGAEGAPEGFYYKGKVYLMSSQLTTPNDVIRVLVHESLGHYGLRGLFGKELKPILKQIVTFRKAEVRAKMREYGLKGTELDMLTAAEEVLANMAETQPQIGLVKRAVAAIRTWLREHVPGFQSLRMSDDELIRNFIIPARNFVKYGRDVGRDQMVPVFQRAWHGSPHRFQKFDSSKMGTGEGAQAYGAGHYFASKKEVADWYRRNLSDSSTHAMFYLNGVEIKADSPERHGASLLFHNGKAEIKAAAKRWLADAKKGGDLGLEDTARKAGLSATEYWQRLYDFVSEHNKREIKTERGQLYEVEIPEDDTMLLWDKPLSEQPEKVREALEVRPAQVEGDGYSADELLSAILEGRDLPSRTRVVSEGGNSLLQALARYREKVVSTKSDSGEQLYRAVTDSLGGDKAASEALAALGIKGIKYLDGTSRSAGDGSYNYVIFDDADAQITGTMFSRQDVTQTPAFKAWFGDSRVTDNGKPMSEGGKPLVVYHGTDVDFSTFDKNKIKSRFPFSIGYHFTTRPTEAGIYASDALGEKMREGGNVMSAYVRLLNPLIVDTKHPAASMEADLNSGPMFDKIREARLAGKPYDGIIIRRERGDEWDGWNVIAFRPEQIKSAIGNNGDFNPSNPDIRFSRGGMDAVKQAASDAFSATMNSPGKLSWWHKTIGTQYNLAERSPEYKRVFDSVQSFLNDVSFYATEAADLAPNLLPKLETIKDLARQPLSAEDTKKLASPVFEGTLIWRRDESGNPIKASELEERYKDLTTDQKAQRLLRSNTISEGQLKAWKAMKLEAYAEKVNESFESMTRPGIVWTTAELKDRFGLTDKQIGFYQEFRESVNTSLTNLALADMLYIAGKDADPIRDDVLGSANLQEASALLRDYLLSIDKGADANRVIQKADQVQSLMDNGYAPLSRFGKYTLDVVKDGERQYFGMYDSPLARVKAAHELQSQFPDAKFTMGTQSEEAYKLFSGVTPDTLELFGDMLGLEGNEAYQEYLKVAKSNRSALKRLIERKGIAGYSEDVGRVLAGFIYSNARQTAQYLHSGEMGEAAEAIPKEMGELKDHAVKLVDYIKNPQEEAQGIRGLLFAQYIAGSVASTLVNLTQPIMMTTPYLSQFGGIGKANKQMLKAFKDLNGKLEGPLAQAMKRAEEDGTVSPQEVHQLMGQASGKATLVSGDGTKAGDAYAAVRNTMSRVQFALSNMFGWAEQTNRRVTFIAAYRTAVEQGMKDPDAFARKAIAETQGVYNKGNKPKWARGAVGSTLFTFKQYGIAYVEMLARMAQNGPEGRRAALYAMGMLMLVAGAGGLPGADDLDDVISSLMQSMGYNFDSKAQRRAFLTEYLGDGAANFLEHGITGLPGAPLDVSGRLGLGNLIPGTGLLLKKRDHTSDVAELAGPAGDMAKRVFTAAGQAIDGDFIGRNGALTTVMPTFIRNAVQAADMADMGMYRDQSGKKVIETDAMDAFVKALGFQPQDVKRIQDSTREVQRMVELNRLKESEIADKWASGIFEKDEGKVQDARDAIKQWNEDNPDTPIKIDMRQVYQRLKNMNMSKDQRIEKSAPKEIRSTVRRELQAVD